MMKFLYSWLTKISVLCSVLFLGTFISNICYVYASWTSGGPFGGEARINDLAIDPSTSNKVFAVIDEGDDLAVTYNSGLSWDYLANSPGHQGAVAIDPQNPSNIWLGDDTRAGGYCNDIHCFCNLGLYVYRSENGGQSWTGYYHHLYSNETSNVSICNSRVSDIMIKPDDSETILIAMTNSYGDLKLTTNDGEDWASLNSPSTTIAANPGNSSYMYHGHQQGFPLTINGKVYVSSNGGETWRDLDWADTWPSGIISVRDLEVNYEYLGESGYAPVYAATESGLIKTVWYGGTDWGWVKVSGLPTDNITALAIDLSTIPGAIYVGTGDAGVFVSLDEASTWTSLNENLGSLNITKLAISKTLPKIIYAGTYNSGVWSNMLTLPISGDINGDGMIDLKDVMTGLQVLAGIIPTVVTTSGDVNSDNRVGLEEVLYNLKQISNQ